MANPGKAIVGIVVMGAGYVIATAPIPGAAQFAGKMVVAWGFGMLVDGVFGHGELSPEGSKLSVTSANAPLPVIYGQRRVSHYLADIVTHGTENSWLTEIGAICLGGESGKGIEGIQNIYLYNDGHTESYVPSPNHTRDIDCQVTGVHTFFYKDPDWYYRYNIGKGTLTQTQDPHMADRYPTRWDETTSGIDDLGGKGIAYIVHGFFYDRDEEKNVWQKGRPTDIQYDVRGVLVYDPRYPDAGPDLDGWIWDKADNGALGTYDNHPGQNPALQLLDYLTSKQYGLGIPYAERDGGTLDEIDEQSFIDVAEHCDDAVTTTGLTSNVTLPRYTANAICSTGDSHKANIEKFLAACNSMLVYEGDKFRLVAKKVTTPSAYEITEQEIIGDILFVRDGSAVPNIINVRLPDEEAREIPWSWTWPYGAWDTSQNGFLEADNGIFNERNIDLSAVTSRVHGQWLAMLYLREAREDSAMTIKCRESAIQLSVGDVVNVTYDSAGFSQTPFWVVGMEINSDDTVLLHLKEYGGAGAYSLDANEDRPSTPDSDLPDPFTVAPPTTVVANCAAGYYLNDATFIPRVEVTWTHTVDVFAHEEELVYRRDADTEWIYTGVKKKIADTAVVAWEGDLDIDEDYWFGVVAWNRLGVRSEIAETATFCTITGPGDTPDDVSITASDYTCLEGMTLSFDNPAVYTDPGLVGAREIGFFSVEIREQGAGATELDRWNAGTHLETVFGTEWNYPFDKVTKGTYDLTVRRFDKYGAPATTPTEITLTLSAYPCTGFGDSDPEELGSVVNNGDFEKGFAYWYSSATTRTSLETVSPIGGAISLKITADGAVDTDVSQTIDAANDESSGGSELKLVPTVPFESWWLGGSAYTSSTNTFEAVVEFFDEDKVSLSETTVITWDDNSAAGKAKSFLAPDGAYYWNLILRAKAGTGDCYVDQLRCVSLVQFQPYAHYDIVHNGGTPGTADVTVRIFDLADRVYDFDMRIWNVATQSWGAWVDDSDPSITVTPFNSFTTDYTWTVTLDEKHDTYTEYNAPFLVQHVGPFDTPGVYVDVGYLREVITLDVDTVPFITNLQLSVRDDGSVDLDWGCDDDGNSIKYTKSTTSYTAAGAPTGGTTLNGTSGNEVGIHTLAYGETLYVRTIAYTGASGTGDPGTKETEAQITHLGGATYPTVKEQLSYSGNDGVLTLVINDPDTRVTKVDFQTKSGTAGWTLWVEDPAPAPYSTTVALTEKHDSHIAWRVTFTQVGGGDQVIEGVVTFDIDTNPEIMSLDLDIEDNGAARLAYSGDDDVASIKWATSTSAYPTGATVDAVTPPTNTNDGRTDSDVDLNAGTIAGGETLYVSFYAYTGTQASGTKSSQLYQIKRTKPTGGDLRIPTVQPEISIAGTTGTIALTLNDPDDVVTGVSWRTYTNGGWNTWVDDFTDPYDLDYDITIEEKHLVILAWKVRYDVGDGNVFIEGAVPFDPDDRAQLGSVTLDVDPATGNVTIAWYGDDDMDHIRYKVSTSAYDTWTDPPPDTEGTRDPAAGSARSNAGTTIYSGLNEGQTLYVTTYSFNSSGVPGYGPGKQPITRGTDTDTKYDTIPADVTGFTDLIFKKYTSSRVMLNWNEVTTPGVSHYEIRYGGTGWADATLEATTQGTKYGIFFGEVPSSARTYRIKAINANEGLESANAATTVVSFSNRPDGSAASLVSSYFRGVGGITRWNLSSTNGSIFRFHWGTTIGFTPSDSNVVALITEDNPSADYAVGISLAESGWTTDAGRSLYLKVGVKDGLSDELGEGWDYSTGQAITLNPFETTWIREEVTGDGRSFINTNYTDSNRRPTTIRTSSGDLGADDIFDKATDTYVTIGAQGEVTYATTAPGSPATGDLWVDTDAVPVTINRWTGSVWDKVGNLTEGALALLDQVDTGQIANKAITSVQIDDNTITAGQIFADTITSNEIVGTTLSAIRANVGVLTAGLIQNSAGVNFIDLDATTTEPFIKAGSDFEVLANGSATFGGTVTSDTFTAATASFGLSIQAHLFTGVGAAYLQLDTATVGDVGRISGYANAGAGGLRLGNEGSALEFAEMGEGIGIKFYKNVDITGNLTVSGTYPGSGGGTTLDALTDTNITGPTNNDLLQWDSTPGEWVDVSLSEAGISPSSHTHTVANLTDTVISSVGNGEVLVWANGTDWINRTLSEAGISGTGHSHSAPDLNDLGNVTINPSDPANDEILAYNGTIWINQTAAEAGLASSSHNHAGTYEPDLGTPASNGYILSSTTGDVRSWIAPPSGGSTTLSGLTDTIISGTPANNEVLAWNGSGDWINQTASEAGLATSGHNHDGDYSLIEHNHNSTYPGITHTETISGTWTFSAATTYVESIHVNSQLDITGGANCYIDASLTTSSNLYLKSGGSSNVYMQNGTETARRVASVYNIVDTGTPSGTAYPYGCLYLVY